MAAVLKRFEPKRILDIGCGVGTGILTLLDVLGSGLRIISIDENKECIQTCFKSIKNCGVTVNCVLRNRILWAAARRW